MVELERLLAWHVAQAHFASERFKRAGTKDCRESNAASIKFHSDAAELLSDLLAEKKTPRAAVVHYLRSDDGYLECTVRAVNNAKTTRDRDKVTCKRCLFDLERTERILGGEPK